MEAFLHTNQSISQSASATICPHCHIHLDSPEALGIHIRITHAPTMQGFPCRYCEKIYSTEESVLTHQGSHMGNQLQFGSEMINSNIYGTGGVRFPQTPTETFISLQQNTTAFPTLSPYLSMASAYSQSGGISGMMLPPMIHTGLDVASQFKDIRSQLTDNTQQNIYRQADQSTTLSQPNVNSMSNVGEDNSQMVSTFSRETQVASGLTQVVSGLPSGSTYCNAQIPLLTQARQYNTIPQNVTEVLMTSPTVTMSEATVPAIFTSTISEATVPPTAATAPPTGHIPKATILASMPKATVSATVSMPKATVPQTMSMSETPSSIVMSKRTTIGLSLPHSNSHSLPSTRTFTRSSETSHPEHSNSQSSLSTRTFIPSCETSSSAALSALPSSAASMSEGAMNAARTPKEDVNSNTIEEDVTESPCSGIRPSHLKKAPTTPFDQTQSQLVKPIIANCQSDQNHEGQSSNNRTKNDNVQELEKTMKQHWAAVEKQITSPSSETEHIMDESPSIDKRNLNDQVNSETPREKVTSNDGKCNSVQLGSTSFHAAIDREGVERRNDGNKINADKYGVNMEGRVQDSDYQNLEPSLQKADTTNRFSDVDEEVFKDDLTCRKCNQEFKTNGGLKRHMTRKHNQISLISEIKGKKCICTTCHKVFRTKLLLNAHMKTHEASQMQIRQSRGRQDEKQRTDSLEETESTSKLESPDRKGKQVCEVCLKTFKNVRALNMHKISHRKSKYTPDKRKAFDEVNEDDEDPLSCKLCNKKFKSDKGLAHHLENHKKKTVSCMYCDEVFQFKKDLTHHKRSNHKEEMVSRSRERTHVCSVCSKAFLEKCHLNEHERRHGEADIPCLKCDKKFKFITDLRKHQRTHSDHKPFVCTTCGATFKASSHLSEHELRHGEAKFLCQQCGKKYHIEREMKKHERTHGSKIYLCQHCAEEFNDKSVLKMHELEHEQAGTITIKQYMCFNCNLHFASQKGLSHHLNNKHKELLKPEEQWQFTCNKCDRVCPTQEALRHHKKTHKGDKVHPCSKCQKLFKSLQHLREHLKRHGEPNLSCSKCDCKFALQGDLRKHERRHVMNKTLPCTHCDKKFSTNGALNAHIKRHTQSASSFVCTHCKLGFKSNLGLKYHLNHKHLEKLPLSERWTHLCDHCNHVFPTKSSMLRHKEMQGKFSCQMCGLNFRTGKAYKQHQQIHLGLRKHCCTVCKKGFMKSHHLAEHMKRHSEGKNPCKLCGKKYVFLTDLRKHMKLSHFSPKLEACTQCDKKFLGDRMLRQHVLLHHQAPVEKRYVCYDCNLQFSGRKGLMSHMNNKHRDKLSEKERWTFQCEKCHRMFRSANALEAHAKVHSSNRPHECSLCGKRFKEARHVLEHEQRHQEGQYSCPKCGKKYVFERDLTKHMKTHNDVKEFECSECGKGFAKKSDLNVHLLRHEQSKDNTDSAKTVHCRYCTLKFVHKKGLDTHMNNKHRDLLEDTQRWPFWCERCKKAFRTKLAMKKHEPEHLGKRDYECNVCNKTFKEPRHLSEHQKRHEKPTLQCQFCDKKYVFERDLQKHERTHSEEKPYKCTRCSRQYMLESALEAHIKQHELTLAKYVCKFCSLGFTSNTCLQNHLNNNHREQLNPTDRWNHICKFCSKAYPAEQGLKKHEKVHRNLRDYSCKVCGKQFKLAHHLTQHEKRHQEGEIACEYCQKKYVFASDLRKHVRIHTGEKPFCCEYCEKRFRVSGGLRKHVRLHEQSSIPGLKCSACKKSFLSMEKLTTHMKVHGEKQFTCTICNKKFCFEKTLQRHVLTHSTIKPFACTLCAKQFVEEMALGRHMKKHENGLLKNAGAVKQHPCNFCNLCFATEYKKNYHMNKMHRDVIQQYQHVLKWNFVCTTCNKPFATEHALQRHESTHTAHQVSHQCLLCPKKFKSPEQFAAHEKWHSEQAQAQAQQQIYVCKYCNKGFINIIDFRNHENAHASDAIVTVPLQGDLTYGQDGLVQVSLRDAGFGESATNQQVGRNDGQFEFLAELISATNNILTLNN